MNLSRSFVTFATGSCRSTSTSSRYLFRGLLNHDRNGLCRSQFGGFPMKELDNSLSASLGPYVSSNVSRRRYGVRSGQSFTTTQATEQFVQWLMPEERKALFQALIKYQSAQDKEDQAKDGESTPSFYQLQLGVISLSFPNISFPIIEAFGGFYALMTLLGSNAVPFIGFGFLDNAIMILAGDYIDKTIGITLGISTMAAAALGNLISDLLGIGLAGYVETLAGKLGFDMPPLSPRQASMWQTIYSSYVGRAFGIVIGCLIGMFPLLLLDEESRSEE